MNDHLEPLELSARVVMYPSNGVDRISFHHELGRYEGRTGRLTLDDGTDLDVRVTAGFLEVVPPVGV